MMSPNNATDEHLGDAPNARPSAAGGPETRRVELERRCPLRQAGELPTQPVLLDDRECRWRAHDHWTPEYLVATVGHRHVTIDGADYSVRGLLDRIEQSTPESPAPYLRAQKLAEVFPELAADIEPMMGEARPNWAENRILLPSIRRTRHPEILLGGRGARFHVLHYDKDLLHAFITQIYGSKELFLLSPEQGHRVYPFEATPNQSSVDIAHPDLQLHPQFAEAHVIQTTLRPGDTVYLPPGWWHTTLMNETSISLTWNMVDRHNWRQFSDATRRRVARRLHPLAGNAFAAYAAAFGTLARTTERARRQR